MQIEDGSNQNVPNPSGVGGTQFLMDNIDQLTIPEFVSYKDVKPMGFPTEIKKLKVAPQQFFNKSGAGDLVRFQITSGGYLDPYTTMINYEVSLDVTQAPQGILQLDGSAHSFISEVVLTCKGTELERITEYDTLAQCLLDMQYDPATKAMRLHEGQGHGNYSNRVFKDMHNGGSRAWNSIKGFKALQNPAAGVPQISPTIGQQKFNNILNSQGVSAFNTDFDMDKIRKIDYINTQAESLGHAMQEFHIQDEGTSLGDMLLGTDNLQHQEISSIAARRNTFASTPSWLWGALNGFKEFFASDIQTKTPTISELLYQNTHIVDKHVVDGGFGRKGNIQSVANQINQTVNTNFSTDSGYSALPYSRVDENILKNTFTYTCTIQNNGWQGFDPSSNADKFSNIKDDQLWTKYLPDYLKGDVGHKDYDKGFYQLAEQGIKHTEASNQKGAFNEYLTNAAWAPCMSANVKQALTKWGNLDQKDYITAQHFKVPFLSGLIGMLMPPESFRLVPLRTLDNLQIEIRLSNYAYFSSGFDDYDDEALGEGVPYKPYDAVPLLGTQQAVTVKTLNHLGAFKKLENCKMVKRRAWKLNRIEIEADVVEFSGPMQDILNAHLNEGVFIHTNSWMLAYTHTLSSSGNLGGTFHINAGFESMKQLMCVFLDNSFLRYDYCRKQFRINNAVTQLQLHIGLQNFPNWPILGHAGCPQAWTNDNNVSNISFMMETYKAFGKVHDVSSVQTMNQVNFAVNKRSYCPNAPQSGSYWHQKAKMIDTAGPTANIKVLEVNPAIPGTIKVLGLVDGGKVMHIHQGWPLFYENQVVGKAIYSISTETINNDQRMITGVSTIRNRPFQLDFKVDSSINRLNLDNNSMTQDSTMFVFCHYDVLIKLSTGAIDVLGRA